MGKPSKQLSRRFSNQSLRGTASKSNISNQSLRGTASKSNMNNPPITAQKSTRAKQKQRQKTNETIKKLFGQLRRESKSQLERSRLSSQSSQTSVIELDDTSVLNNTIITGNVSTTEPKTVNLSMTDAVTRSLTEMVSSKSVNDVQTNKSGYRKSKQTAIVIKDDDLNSPSTSTPNKSVYSLHHSTPIKLKPSIDELILSVNNQLVKDDSISNKTKEINASSFLTIDLTTDSRFNRSTQPTIIDLDTTNDQQDCVIASVSQGSSMSGDSDVTVLRRPARKRSIVTAIKNGLANLNATEKDKLLTFMSETLFNGCAVPTKIEPRALETAEDTYIKEVILGRKLSRNSIGSNVYNPEKYVNTTGLRMVVIDGSNVAMAHGHHQYFSVHGLKIVINYFLSRGHAVKAFVPRFRNKLGKSNHPQLLCQLERQGLVIFTPSREVQGKVINSYDDRYIIQCAAEFEGVIVSNDGFRDLIHENPRWAQVINNRVLQYNWVNGMIMFPQDPLGRNGPTLAQFLKMPNKPQIRNILQQQQIF